jgi:hypothetical protein
MNLLNKELIGIAVAIGVLYAIQLCIPKKKKEGFVDSQTGTVIGVILLFLLVVFGIGYMSFQIKF